MPLPRPKNARASTNCHSSVATAHVKADSARDRDAGTHHQRCVAAVGVARQPDLRDESGEEADAHEDTQLLFAETELVAEVGQEGIDRPVAE